MKTSNKFSGLIMKGLLALFLSTAVLSGLLTAVGCSQPKQEQNQAKKTIYTCSMHHQIRRDKPGDCPICGMTLIPLDEAGVTPAPPQTKKNPVPAKKIKFWANPMNPAQHSGKPEKDEMGMDYVPVYEEEAHSRGEDAPDEIRGLVPIHISAYKEQLIDVKFASVRKAPLTRAIRTIGRFAGGAGDFAVLASDFTAREPSRSTARYVVADVYALDLPFVKVGQKAVITSLNGPGSPVTGLVALVYPYDQTQSRVTRVKISLPKGSPPGIFANVEIQAGTAPRLAVPPTAVMDTGTQRYVFIQTSPGNFTPQPVLTGYEGNDLWEIISGLKEGDQVVDGALFLIDADSKLKAAFAETK